MCVEAAVEEARSLGHDSVSDEDLLLGILAADDGIAARALSSLGVTSDRAREEVKRQFADALLLLGISLDDVRRQAGEAFELRSYGSRRLPFSPLAKKTLERSLSEALRLNANRITAEHILLGILRNKRGRAVEMLATLDVSVEEVEGCLERLCRP